MHARERETFCHKTRGPNAPPPTPVTFRQMHNRSARRLQVDVSDALTRGRQSGGGEGKEVGTARVSQGQPGTAKDSQHILTLRGAL